MEDLDRLVKELIDLPAETPWLEFKHDNYDPWMIGRGISALANSAALHGKACAYMLWGVDDATHEIVGTDHDLQGLKRGNEELGNWLRSLLSPNADFTERSVQMEGKAVNVLVISKAAALPVTFEKRAYIRVGSYTKKLDDLPSMQAQLWDRLRDASFEERLAQRGMSLADALQALDHPAYFDIKGVPQPTDIEGVAHYMTEEGLLVRQDDGLYAVSNLGAMLLAKRLSDFPRLERKAVRVVQYASGSRLDILKETVEPKGYVAGFGELIHYIEALLPSQEPIDGAFREKRSAYPILAIREAIANALIHQDFSITGTGPLVEIFPSRIEITNPGTPLVDIKRIIDNPPRSRNERLASLMRRLGICEELGTGWDKIALACELARLPAPRIDLYEENTKVTLSSEMPFSNIPAEDKIWACYLHACIRQVQGEQLTNGSLRDRFGLKPSSSGSVSRLIREAVRKGLIKPLDPDTAPRHMRYVPIWA